MPTYFADNSKHKTHYNNNAIHHFSHYTIRKVKYIETSHSSEVLPGGETTKKLTVKKTHGKIPLSHKKYSYHGKQVMSHMTTYNSPHDRVLDNTGDYRTI